MMNVYPRITDLSASYIIFSEGGVVYARNGKTNQIDFSGTDASTVIQSVIDALRDRGGRILIKSGVYIVDTLHVEGVSNISIVGEGFETKLVAKLEDTIVFKIGDRTNQSKFARNIEIAYLMIDGSNQATETTTEETVERRFGIEVVSPDGNTNAFIHHCYIYNTGSDSIYIWSSDSIIAYNIIENTRGYWASIHEHCPSSAPYGYPATKATIIYNKIINSSVSSIRHGRIIAYNTIINSGGKEFTDFLKSAIVGGEPGCIIIGNDINGIRPIVSGIQFSDDGCDDNIIDGNIIVDPAYPYNGYNGWGIYVKGNNNVIKNNKLFVTDTSTIRPEAFIEENGSGNVITGNILQSGVNYRRGAILRYGTNTIVKNNIGYITENSGTAIFSGDGSQTVFTIAHGLAGTPKSWHVDAASADAMGAKYVTADATNLTVTFATAPPAGTDNVVLVWSAEM